MLANFNAPGSLASNPVTVYLASLSPGSRRTMRQSLNAIAEIVTNGLHDAFTFEWHQLRYQHTTAIRTTLAERYSPATANKILAAMKRTLKECKRLGQMTPDDYDKAVDLPPIKGSSEVKGRALSPDELRSLFAACAADESLSGARDGAMLAVLRIGLRRQEVVKLNVADIDTDTAAVTIRQSKGGKTRTAYLTDSGLNLILHWLEKRTAAEFSSLPLFVPISRGGNLLDRRLTDQSVLTILRHRSQAIGLQDFSPHDFRRTFAGDLLDAGVDIATVQKLMGHSDIKTTAGYDRRGEKAKRRAVSALDL